VLERLTELPSLIVAGAIGFAVVFYLLRGKNCRARRAPHDYFQRLWICRHGSGTRWEAELDVEIPGADRTVGFHSAALHDQVAVEGPTDPEVAFCKRAMENLNELFELTRPAIEEAWTEWGEGKLPEDWTTVLKLDGLSVPSDGNIKEPWSVVWFCNPAGHYFVIELRGGKASLASIDG